MDVADEDQVNAGVEQAAREFGALDVLVSNAGIQIIHPIVDFPFSDWRKVLAVHLDGAFLTTRAAMRLMIRQGPRRNDSLHGFDSFAHRVAEQISLRRRETRDHWPGKGCR